MDEVREVHEMHRAGTPSLGREVTGNGPRHGPCRAARATGLPCTRPATRGPLCVVPFRAVLAGRTLDEEIADCLALADARHERARERGRNTIAPRSGVARPRSGVGHAGGRIDAPLP